MKIYSRVLLFVASLFLFSALSAANIELKVRKKAEKKIFKTFSRKDIAMTFIDIPNIDLNQFGVFTKLSLAKLNSSDGSLGYVMFNSSVGRTDFFDYMIIFDKDLKIISSFVLAYRSNHGSEIASSYWLKQFKGKYNGQLMEAYTDIDIISGATMSGESFTDGAAGMSRLLYALKENIDL